ncbi:MAG: hypothetical protein Q8L96_12910 [Hylemonella sp.]|nr:hypothetical protein [Hylemonella sp.]
MAAVDSVHQHRFSINAPLGLSRAPILASQSRQLTANDTHGRTVFRHKPQHTQTHRSSRCARSPEIVRRIIRFAPNFNWPTSAQ